MLIALSILHLPLLDTLLDTGSRATLCACIRLPFGSRFRLPLVFSRLRIGGSPIPTATILRRRMTGAASAQKMIVALCALEASNLFERFVSHSGCDPVFAGCFFIAVHHSTRG